MRDSDTTATCQSPGRWSTRRRGTAGVSEAPNAGRRSGVIAVSARGQLARSRGKARGFSLRAVSAWHDDGVPLEGKRTGQRR